VRLPVGDASHPLGKQAIKKVMSTPLLFDCITVDDLMYPRLAK